MSLEALIKRNKIRPVRGHLIGVKHRRTQDIDTPFGVVTGSLASGLVVVREETPEDALARDTSVIVLRVGEDPEAWSTRFFEGDVVHPTSWSAQGITRGVLVYARGVAQAPLGAESPFVQLRYDDIAGIALPAEDTSDVPCRPAPGFVLVRVREYEEKVGSIYVRSSEYAEVLQEREGQWGEVVSLAIDDATLECSVGDMVLFPRYQLTEFIDLDGGFKLIPTDDVLAVEEV